MHSGKPLSGEATIRADDFVWSESSHIPGQPTGKPLSGEATIPADDFVWSESSHIPGQPKPIPPQNEPLLYIPILHNNPHTSFDECSINECEIGSRLASAVAQAAQACAQEIQHEIHHKTRDVEHSLNVAERAERGKHLYNTISICLLAH
jgi:hypothetical protein